MPIPHVQRKRSLSTLFGTHQSNMPLSSVILCPLLWPLASLEEEHGASCLLCSGSGNCVQVQTFYKTCGDLWHWEPLGSFFSLGSDANLTVTTSEIVFWRRENIISYFWNKIINASVILKSISYLIQSLFYFTKMHTEVRRQ